MLKIDFYLFTNNTAVNKKEVDISRIISRSDQESIIDFNFRIYDLNELQRLHKNNQKLDIDVKDYYSKPINVLKAQNWHIKLWHGYYNISGAEFLYNIYSEFGARLLESNVRSFLNSRVKVNKGIKRYFD